MNTKTLHLVSLGCTKNLVDSEVMLGRLKEYKLVDTPESADVIIVNTCGFIDAAKEESINTILSLHEARKKESLLVMSGCLSQRYKNDLQAGLKEVDIFTGVGDYDKIDKLIELKKSTYSDEIFLSDETHERVITGSNYHAYIKIAEGCNQACSFCAIPHFKGKLHSRTLSSIVKEVQSLVKKGFWDFSFISQDSSSYGRDIGLKDGLVDLIKEVEKIDGVKSARILYLYPSTTTFDLIDTIADSKVFQTYYDMPIQHINDDMLKTMKRGFGENKTKALLEYMKSKDGAFIRTTFIAGHPEESEESFNELCEFVKSFGFDRANVFSYSNEEETTAYEMQQLPKKVIDKRAKILGDIVEETTLKSLETMVNKTIDVVIDGVSDEHEYLLSARPLAWAVEVDGEILVNDTNDIEVEFGKVYKAKITELVGNQLLAKIISEQLATSSEQ
ncbi:Ribosomal protein S12 methylthiotransferase RimO [Sulfurovum sp. enrichment culture clone C5]|uniref:Ribosomal protein uS12 methylthiotransferase RimO n=1 Tax=Sulfurovum sp. enrichment culture clone C5 TaxID=497650 RepID=A0A0S4XQ76_9BACT|nr:Ribosomal protein S12 methylthiotransferase RimO [Sulfurovum sp. enrichment culture clone C5]